MANISTGVLALALIFSIQGNAGEIQTTVASTTNQVIITATLPQKFNVLYERFKDSNRIGGMLKVPMIRKITDFFREPAKLLSSSANVNQWSTSRKLLVAGVNQRFLQPSLVNVTETYNECKISDCKNSLTAFFDGPVHTYDSFYKYRKSDFPRGAITLNLTITELSSAECQVSFQFDITSRAYMDFVKDLQKRNLIKEMPTEENIKTAFMAWSKQVMDEMAK